MLPKYLKESARIHMVVHNTQKAFMLKLTKALFKKKLLSRKSLTECLVLGAEELAKKHNL